MIADQAELDPELRDELQKAITPAIKALEDKKEADRRVSRITEDTKILVKKLNKELEDAKREAKEGKVPGAKIELKPSDIKEATRKLLIKKDSDINRLTRELAEKKPDALSTRTKELELERDRLIAEKRELIEKLAKAPTETKIIEKVVEKVVYRDAPKPPTDPTARPPQTPKPQTQPQPKQSTEPRQGTLIRIEEKGIWTNKLLQELLDVYDDILIRAGVSLKNKIASFNISIRRMMEDPLIADKVIIEDEITRLANDVALANSLRKPQVNRR
jgi:hypothetical protein